MNIVNKMLLQKAAAKFKEKEITRVLINWEESPESEKFFAPVKKNDILVDSYEYHFLLNFYNHNKK